MLTSPRSEDWVTWNTFVLLERAAPDAWWPYLVSLAKRDNPELTLPENWKIKPAVSLWRCVTTPPEYEARRRSELSASDLPKWIARSREPGPVEGDSEIDITLQSAALTVFVEAKLGSDISLHTTYDPARNQIVRNIDCLLEESRATEPFFWMLVRDTAEAKSSTQLMRAYRTKPELLAQQLPTRQEARVKALAGRLAIVLWKDLLDIVPSATLTDEQTETFNELQSRVS